MFRRAYESKVISNYCEIPQIVSTDEGNATLYKFRARRIFRGVIAVGDV